MYLNRREVLKSAAATTLFGLPALQAATAQAQDNQPMPIIDTHQHLWDISEQNLLWLAGAPAVLRRNYLTKDYLQATAGLPVTAIYMEVNVDPKQHVDEAERILKLCRSDEAPTRAAVIGGRPASDKFPAYLDHFRDQPAIKGIRQVLHDPEIKQGTCLQPNFVRGIQALGQRGLSFDLCMRPSELADALKLVKLCPDTNFVVDHCGNADPKAFRPASGDEKPWHDAEDWKRQMGLLAEQKNVICKISGIVARAPEGWTTDDLAPIVNHCLDSFGPDRVVFGGDWPVCLLGSPLANWIKALQQIVASRPTAQQAKLWHENATRFYRLS